MQAHVQNVQYSKGAHTLALSGVMHVRAATVNAQARSKENSIKGNTQRAHDSANAPLHEANLKLPIAVWSVFFGHTPTLRLHSLWTSLVHILSH